jgi:APA family basic amino acid/polyamine antiporter
VASLAICALLYVAMSLVMTGLADFRLLNTASPISTAIRIAAPERLAWLLFAVNVGVVVGLVSAVLISLFGQSRVFYAMAREGQMPAIFAHVNARGVPARGVLLVGGAAALIAGIFPLALLGELVATGSLLAFASVCASTFILRRTMPELARPFEVPMGPIIAATGLILCLALMLTLPGITLAYFAAWLLSGCALYGIALARRRALP